jgi:hypothetical protein
MIEALGVVVAPTLGGRSTAVTTVALPPARHGRTRCAASWPNAGGVVLQLFRTGGFGPAAGTC